MDSETSTAPVHSSAKDRWAQAAVVTLLYSFPALVCAHNAHVGDLDVWWHLRTGQWMLQNGAVPRVEPFTSFAAGKPWVEYSWLFDLVIYQLFQRLGLIGIVTYIAGMTVVITMALHRLNRRLQSDFTVAALLTLAGSICMMHLWMPRPWLFTILFFIIEVDVLMQARMTGKSLGLWGLPLLFALWANLHIQFLDGLMVLAIAVAEAVAARWRDRARTQLGAGLLCSVFVVCVAATLANPYGWHVYEAAYGLASQKGVLETVTEMTAMPFRDASHYGVLFFAMGATAALARARRWQIFELALLLFAVVVSFRSQRDVWVVVTASSAILAAGIGREGKERTTQRAWAVVIAVAATVVVAPLTFVAARENNDQLAVRLAETLPVRAAKFVRDKGLKGPLFNDYSWGGYLMWDPGLPVSIDGRAAIAGDELIDRTGATWNGAPDWACNPELKKAHLVIGPVTAPLTQLLSLGPGFELVYKDTVAAVFVSREGSQAGQPASNLPACAMAQR